MFRHYALLSMLGVFACTGADTDTDTDSDTETDTDTDTDVEIDPAEFCNNLGLTYREFDTGEAGRLRHELAGDFSLPLEDGSTWTYSDHWTGCDSVILLPHAIETAWNDESSVWFTGIDALIDASPPNAIYIFIPYTGLKGLHDEVGIPMRESIDMALASRSDEEAAWWRNRLIVPDKVFTDFDHWVADSFLTFGSAYGIGVDTTQHIRTLGGLADVNQYDSSTPDGRWPWASQLYMAAHETTYWNFENIRQQRLDAVETDEVVLFDRFLGAQYEDIEVTLPDVATLQTYDTLEIDVVMECPDEEAREQGNCGAWDYLAHMYLLPEGEEGSSQEMARFITTYHRESRWVVDATQALPWLIEGARNRTFRYSWAPSWNTQPTIISVRLRLSNQGKGYRPLQTVPLFTGGSFNSGYNEGREEPLDVDIPASATRVELRSIITGHGGDGSNNCAEFCNHQHEFTVGSSTYFKEHTIAGSGQGCEEAIADGVVPNQSGTWWFGRGGWCPGQRVDPNIDDVTGDITAGSTVQTSYKGKWRGGEVTDSAGGNIKLSSWLVIYE